MKVLVVLNDGALLVGDRNWKDEIAEPRSAFRFTIGNSIPGICITGQKLLVPMTSIKYIVKVSK